MILQRQKIPHLLRCNDIWHWPGAKIWLIKTLYTVHPLFCFLTKPHQSRHFLTRLPLLHLSCQQANTIFEHSVQIFFRALGKCCLDKCLLHVCEWRENNRISWTCSSKRRSTFQHYMWRRDRSSCQETGLQAGRHQALHSTSLGSLHLTGAQLPGAILQSARTQTFSILQQKAKPRCSVKETQCLINPHLHSIPWLNSPIIQACLHWRFHFLEGKMMKTLWKVIDRLKKMLNTFSLQNIF